MTINEQISNQLKRLNLVPETFIEAFLEQRSDDAMREIRVHLEDKTEEETEDLLNQIEGLEQVLPHIALYIMFAQRERKQRAKCGH